MMKNEAAVPRYAKAKTTVWWDMTVCPVPDGYDARMVGPCIYRALEKLGYYGRLSITAYGDLKHIPDSVVLALSSTGIVIIHVHSGIKCMFPHLYDWGTKIRPPANFMLISNLSGLKLMSDPLNCLQEKDYNILVALSHPLPEEASNLIEWKTLLADSEEPLKRRTLRQEGYAFTCRLCKVAFNSCEHFTAHLTGKQHELQGYLLGPDLPYMEGNVEEAMTLQLEENLSIALKQLRKICKNVVVEPDSNKAMVLWDIDFCPVRPDYDACLVGLPLRVESVFKKIGFSGSFTVTAIGDLGELGFISPEVLRAISSSGIVVKHAPFGNPSIINDMLTWVTLNPPPAKIILISSSSCISLLECMPPILESLRKNGYHAILVPVEDLETLPADIDRETRGQTGESACFICSTCDLSCQSYESFYIHINSEEHRIQSFRTCYYYRNQEPGSGTRYAPAVKKLSKEGLHISSFLMKLMRHFRKSMLEEAEPKLNKVKVGSSCLSNTTTAAKKQSKTNSKKMRIE